MKTLTLLSIVFCSILAPLTMFAQNGKLFETEDGLSSSFINQIYQDRDGFIWIATESGLNKFDGITFTNYLNTPGDSTSIKSNYVRCLFQDDNNLLVGCYNGLMRYDKANDLFHHIPMYVGDSEMAPHVTQISKLKNGEIWLATSGRGLFKYDSNKDAAFNISELMEKLQIYVISNLFEDSKGRIWLSTEYNGIIRIDSCHQTFEIYRYPRVPDNGIYSIAESKDGEIIVGTKQSGVARYDSINNCFQPILDEGKVRYFSAYIVQNINDEIWVGCDGEGVKRYNSLTKELEAYKPNIPSLGQKRGRIHALLEDRDKNIWIGMCQKGVILINHNQVKFDYIGHRSIRNNSIGLNCVTSIYKDKDNHLWVGHDYEGIFEVNQEGQQVRHFKPFNEGGSVPGIVYGMFEDSNGNFWIGSIGDRVGWLNKKTGKFSHIDELPIRNVLSIVEDNQKNIYLGTFGDGLYRFNLESKELTSYKSYKGDDIELQKQCLANNWINKVIYDSEGLIWIAHYKGISCFNPSTNSFTHYTDSNMIIDGCIGYVLMEDKEGDIWAGTSDGLFHFDKQLQAIIHFTQADGLANNVICGIGEDDNDFIWVSSCMGVSRFNISKREFINYSVKDGLQGNEFFRGASFQDNNGRIYFGGINGITAFNPSDITAIERELPIYITDFSILQQSISANTLSGGKPVINTSVMEANTFRLSYQDNTFSISFATMTFDNTNQITYQYRIKELYDIWMITEPGQNKVTYNNLPPGKYTFEVYASTDNIPLIKTVNIVITPPWYLSWWAYLIYTLVIIAIIGGIINYIRMRLVHRQQLLEQKHSDEIKDAKLQFFINISHEIRTPMTLIMAPLERLLKTNTDKDLTKSYQLIYSNAHRILNIINQLMDIHKMDKGKMKLHFEETNLTSFIDEIIQSFDFIAYKRNIALTFIHPDIPITAWIDNENFDKVLMNIISNAFKYTPENGAIEIQLSKGRNENLSTKLANYIEIAITDNGIGIDGDKMEQIFDCFYRIDNPLTQKSIGTGIGLYLSRLLVNLHHGEIKVVNMNEEKGCRFIIRIPQGASHLPKEDVCAKSTSNIDFLLHSQHIPTFLEEEDKLSIKTKGSIRILVVEDNVEICNLLYGELGAEYKVTICSNGKEAYDSILSTTPDLVISDVMMPIMDGIELCQKIRGNITINHLPIILLTAKSGVEDKVFGIEKGADAYIEKPFNMDVLRSTISNLLKNRHLLRTKYSGAQEQLEKVNKLTLKSPDEQLMERIMKVINDNISNPELNVETIASQVGLSRVHVHRKMKELTNQSTRDFIKNTRLQQAALLLQEKNLGISDVAYATGFTTLSYFSALFKGIYGVTPKEYKQHHSKVEE